MASGSTREMRKSKGFDSESIPIPSPRNLSAVKMSSLEQSEEQKSRLDSHHNSDHPTSGALEGGEQNLTALSQEVDYLRQTNKKLQEALMSRERELDTLKLDAELLEQASQARIAERTAGSAAPPSAAVGRVPPDVSAPPSSTAGRRPPSSQHAAAAGEHRKCRSKTQALVEEVYCAQRERDEAVMARLRLANQERDEALIRVQQLQLFLRELEDINPEEGDLTLQELLGRLGEAEGGAAIQQNGELILERIRRSQERREQITAEEMGAVIRERDAARAQCKHLEKELHLLRESKQICTDIVTAQRTFHPASKHDEDKVIEDYKKLEEELQNLRIYYSLHQSLSQEANLKEQFSAAMALYDEALRNREELLRINQQQNQELGLQLHEAQSQNAEMQESLRRAAACQQEMEEKVHKLERLVDVLRKKVGVGNVRTVI